ncbi:hypothetical protein AAG570_002721 [Ranatra chinensis]|uniref:Uncharacterized protein n=1 Tax=Ranatra chinensis TaxID=642074 RepID=A0ABD0Y8F7_9HEMI
MRAPRDRPKGRRLTYSGCAGRVARHHNDLHIGAMLPRGRCLPTLHRLTWASEATRGSKEKGVEAINETSALDRQERVREGDTTWVKSWNRRRKMARKFVGPFREVRILT